MAQLYGVNKHHLLYPEKAFRGAGEYGVKLRDFFVVRMLSSVHMTLHGSLDCNHQIGNGGVDVSEYKNLLPGHSTLKDLYRQLEVDSDVLTGASAIDMLTWLANKLEQYDDGVWLYELVCDQMKFFKEMSNVA